MNRYHMIALALLLAVPLAYNAPQVLAKSDAPGTILALSDTSLTGGANVITSTYTMTWDGVLRVQFANDAGGSAAGVDVVLNNVAYSLNGGSSVSAGNVAAFTVVVADGDTLNIQVDTSTTGSLWIQEIGRGQ